jgi:hypothetical protein
VGVHEREDGGRIESDWETTVFSSGSISSSASPASWSNPSSRKPSAAENDGGVLGSLVTMLATRLSVCPRYSDERRRLLPIMDDKSSDQVKAVSDHTLDKALEVTPNAPEPATTNPEPTHEEIAVVAHEIYEKEGSPQGLAETHWETAESDLHRETFNGM